MGKLNLTVNLDNLSQEDRDKFFELVEKSKEKKSFNPFERVNKHCDYCYIDYTGDVCHDTEYQISDDDECFDCHNYYNDKEFAKHQALRELLNRKLMKFSYENGGVDIEDVGMSYSIHINNGLFIVTECSPDILAPLFISSEVANKAINEVIKPFLKEHSDFKWWG